MAKTRGKTGNKTMHQKRGSRDGLKKKIIEVKMKLKLTGPGVSWD